MHSPFKLEPEVALVANTCALHISRKKSLELMVKVSIGLLAFRVRYHFIQPSSTKDALTDLFFNVSNALPFALQILFPEANLVVSARHSQDIAT